jgi:hypothetical protein
MKNTTIKLALKFGNRIFTRHELRNAWKKTVDPRAGVNGFFETAAYLGLMVAKTIRLHVSLAEQYTSLYAKDHTSSIDSYNSHWLHLRLNRVYDLPSVVVDERRMPTINVLVPAFNFSSMSAGFFGVFQVARFLRCTGKNIRLVLFDNFPWDLEHFRKRLKGYPELESLCDEVEIEYIGERTYPLLVSKSDNCVATVWYSAYLAKKIMDAVDGRKFIYLIQDYETNFHPGGTHFALADETYKFDYTALFSTESLQNYFLENDIGGIASRALPYTYFNNACASNLLPWEEFLEAHKKKRKKRIVFYSRPIVDRNMFELSALALAEAYKRGIFDPNEWECIGMGLGEGRVELLPNVATESLPRMNLKEYKTAVSTFDICLSLMASPHPSLIPMDLAGSGSIVVTNTFYTKTVEYFGSICSNIIAANPDLESLVTALENAKQYVDSFQVRYEAAGAMNYPRNWQETFSERHEDWARSVT